MKITYLEIINFFDLKGIKYKLKGKPVSDYIIASLFSPIENGFYFIEGTNSTSNLNNSLILTNSKSNLLNNNVLIEVEESPQILYYQLLVFYYKEVSSGEICTTAKIHKDAEIGKNVQIDSFVVLGKCKIGNNSIIKSHCVINDNIIIENNVTIEPHCTIGARGMAWVWDEAEGRILQPQLGGVIIKCSSLIGSNSVIVRGSLNENTIIGRNAIMAPGARIGHGCKIGDYTHFANNVVTGGNVVINKFCFIGSSVTIRPKVEIHSNTIVGAGALVIKNTKKEGLTLKGVPAKEFKSKKDSSGVPILKN